MTRFGLLLALTVLLAAGPAWSKGAHVAVEYGDAYTRCISAPDATTASTVQCTVAELKAWNDRMNAAYASIMASGAFSRKLKAELRVAQRAWIAARDKICASNADLTAEGGTLARVVGAACILDMTAQRASDLEDFAHREQ